MRGWLNVDMSANMTFFTSINVVVVSAADEVDRLFIAFW